MNKNRVLIVDDEPDICELLSITLSRMGLESDSAASLQQGIEAVKSKDYDLVLSDMRMPDGDGIELVRYVQKHKPYLPIAVITAYGNVEGAVNTLKAGAFDYVSKPINVSMLKELVNSALAMDSQDASSDETTKPHLIGKSAVMEDLRSHIEKLARSQAPVFIHGESGVGKELVAQLIHKQGPRKDKPFVPVNCGAISAELMESEFFGHKKGSFTGAIHDKQGLFEAANGGTLFLDEIAELPLAMQVKLLRAIQEKAIKPVGAFQESSVDVRILSASHKDLQAEIAQERFRQDLYYRINVIELRVPTLKERKEDVPALADNFLRRICEQQDLEPVQLSPASIERLQSYDFPGNVRELENILERAVALNEKRVLEPDDLHLPDTKTAAASADSTNRLTDTLTEHEKDLILDALDKTKWNRTAAAKLLGVSFRTLRYRLKKLGIE